MRNLPIWFILSAVLLALPHPAIAQAPAAPQVTPQQAQSLLNTLQDPQKRAQLVTTLQTLAKTVPDASAAGPLAPDSLGAQILSQTNGWLDRMQSQMRRTVHTVGDLPLLVVWLRHLSQDSDARAWVAEAVMRLVLIVASASAAFWLLRWLLRRPMAALAGLAPTGGIAEAEAVAAVSDETAAHHGRRLGAAWRMMRRLPFILGRLVLDLLPLGAFLLVGDLLLGSALSGPPTAHAAVQEVLDASVLFLLIMVLARLLVRADAERLRLVRISDSGAAYVERWTRRVATVAVFGVALAHVAVLLGLGQAAQNDLIKLVALVVHAMLVVVVVQCRRPVARHLRARRGRTGFVARVLNRFAAVWHWIAIFFLVAFWVVWAIAPGNGFIRLTHFILVTVPVVIGARLVAILALGLLYRLLQGTADNQLHGLRQRATRYYPLVRGGVTAVIWILTIIVLMQLWGLQAFAWFVQGGIGGRLASAVGSVLVTMLLAAVVWEAANAALESKTTQLTQDGQTARVARLQTLLPILRTSLLIVILAIIGLTVLNEIGVNIAPLLAGAGILGVALGFGSQKLVQDLITGLFLLLENAMQVGDFVTVAGLSGTVEHLSIRTIRLRAGDGAVHIVPFSAVTSVTNTNRDIGNAAVSVTIAYDEDTDRASEALKAIAVEMRQAPDFGSSMQSDLQFWGVDKVDATTVTLVGQIVCTAAGRWGVQREFNRRVQRRFRELGIAMGLPGQSIVLCKDTPAMPMPAAETPSPATETNSPAPAALGHAE